MKKNLIFHCFIDNSKKPNRTIKFVLKCLEQYIDIFDGIKVICLTNDSIQDIEILKEQYPVLKKFNKILSFENDPQLRESVTLISLLEEIKTIKKSMTFYFHTKGSTWDLSNVLKNWIFSMFYFNLEETYLREIESKFASRYLTSGILKKDCKWDDSSISGDWHYSGAFFWINNDIFFEKCNWKQFTKGRMSLESYLGQRIETIDSYCTFIQKNYNFHINENLWKEEIDPKKIGSNQYENYHRLLAYCESCI